jgi:hypothetical protein
MTATDNQPHDVTLVDVLRELSDSGYTSDFFVDEDEGSLCCGTCRACQQAGNVRLDGLRRLEGASDPADMAAVLAITCSDCGQQGTAVVRYGPEATPGEATLLRELDDQRPDGVDVAEGSAT